MPRRSGHPPSASSSASVTRNQLLHFVSTALTVYLSMSFDFEDEDNVDCVSTAARNAPELADRILQSSGSEASAIKSIKLSGPETLYATHSMGSFFHLKVPLTVQVTSDSQGIQFFDLPLLTLSIKRANDPAWHSDWAFACKDFQTELLIAGVPPSTTRLVCRGLMSRQSEAMRWITEQAKATWKPKNTDFVLLLDVKDSTEAADGTMFVQLEGEVEAWRRKNGSQPFDVDQRIDNDPIAVWRPREVRIPPVPS